MVLRQPVVTAVNYEHVYQPQLYHDPILASLAVGYRPLQLAEQQQQHQHQQQQQQLALAAAGFHHQAIPHQLRQHLANMAFQHIPDDELAELQQLSNEYEPEVTGPLVGQREASSAITTQYASADLVYQQKTAALPQKYSHYRQVRGDGRCGWRAVAFGYLERLLYVGDSNKFFEEEARLRSLSNVLNAAGFESYLYEDFADELFDLMRKLAGALQTGTGDEILLDALNDDMLQNSVITHLRTLTAAWMKTRPENYAAYLPGSTVDQFCENTILPIGAEIEHVGLSALKDVLLSPAAMALEVVYLDRTAGEEVNLHRFDPVDYNGYTMATVRLLYRPGHYDILYKPEDVPPPPAAIPTYLQYSSQLYNEPASDLGVSDFMTLIPGMSYANPHQAWLSDSGYGGSEFFAAPAQVQQCTQPLPTPPAIAPPPQIQPQTVHVAAAAPTDLVSPPTQIQHELAIRPLPVGRAVRLSHPKFRPQDSPFRPSVWELEPEFALGASHMPFQTSIFRNSHFNTAHFLNPDFQPEEWKPDDEYVVTTKVSRHNPSG